MRKATLFVHSQYTKNQIFNLENPRLNVGNLLFGHWLLKQELKSLGYDISTQDIHPPESSEFTICNEMPPVSSNLEPSKTHLLIMESELIRPDNWDLERHKKFAKIFTWKDSLVDNKKYFKINFATMIPEHLEFKSNRPKLCCLIAGNKGSTHPLELYSHRKRAIDWFERHAPHEFDYYGMGWDQPLQDGSFYKKALKKLGLFKIDRSSKSKCYKGPVENKFEVMKDYSFSICYENAQGIDGYVTEKILDCLVSGCIPIYWGAPNIKDLVPSNCFIDKRNFETYGELYKHLKSLDPEQIKTFQFNIKTFLESEKGKSYSYQNFAETISRETTKNEP